MPAEVEAELLALRRQQEESFLPLVAGIRNRRNNKDSNTFMESLLDVRVDVPEEEGGDSSRAITDGELVSFISEFLGTGTESTGHHAGMDHGTLRQTPRRAEKASPRGRCRCALPDVTIDMRTTSSRMPYLKAVVLESLRRHPSVPFVLIHVDAGDEAAHASWPWRAPRRR